MSPTQMRKEVEQHRCNDCEGDSVDSAGRKLVFESCLLGVNCFLLVFVCLLLGGEALFLNLQHLFQSVEDLFVVGHSKLGGGKIQEGLTECYSSEMEVCVNIVMLFSIS